jgi:hypothetical protein
MRVTILSSGGVPPSDDKNRVQLADVTPDVWSSDEVEVLVVSWATPSRPKHRAHQAFTFSFNGCTNKHFYVKSNEWMKPKMYTNFNKFYHEKLRKQITDSSYCHTSDLHTEDFICGHSHGI